VRKNARGQRCAAIIRPNPPGPLNFSEEFHPFDGGAEIASGSSAGFTGNEEMTESRDRAESPSAFARLSPASALLCLISHRFKDIP